LDEQQLVPIREELRQHQYVFTTSYDLVIYWAAGCAPAPSFQGFVDFFWSDNINAFNRRWCSVTNAEDTRLFYLHGALHLVVTELGTTRKRVRDTDTLLDQFGTPIDGDPTTRPLLISEGASAEKARAIQENAYLRFALSELQTCPEPIVVFGHSLSEQDAHVAEALNARPRRPVAVALGPDQPSRIRSEKGRILSALSELEDVVFFDRTTHPLGSLALRVTESRLMRAFREGSRRVLRRNGS
jgi:hypothetical protein